MTSSEKSSTVTIDDTGDWLSAWRQVRAGELRCVVFRKVGKEAFEVEAYTQLDTGGPELLALLDEDKCRYIAYNKGKKYYIINYIPMGSDAIERSSYSRALHFWKNYVSDAEYVVCESVDDVQEWLKA